MDPQRLQNDLESMYSSWKTNINFREDHIRLLGPPFLIHVTDDYCYAERRVLVIGQETLFWGFYDEKTQAAFLRYQQKPNDDCVWSMEDFKEVSNAVDVLCRGYKAFDLARLHKGRNSPFWRAFREVQRWPQAGVLWGNLSRSDYSPDSGRSRSIPRAPKGNY